jgi:hypothetical protein
VHVAHPRVREVRLNVQKCSSAMSLEVMLCFLPVVVGHVSSGGPVYRQLVFFFFFLSLSFLKNQSLTFLVVSIATLILIL